MAITKAKKGEILKTLEEGLKGAEAVAFVNFHGLPVAETTKFRKELRDKGVTYYVAKKTLVRRALDAKGVTGTMPEFPGELALAWGTDPLGPAKSVYEFAKTHKEQVMLVGGVYEGAYMDKDGIMALATIPSREELYGKFVGMLNASIANVVRAINARAEKLEGAAA